MGMWQGILEGMNQVEAKKTREKELQDARDERAKEFQQQLDVEELRYKRSKADEDARYVRGRKDDASDAASALATKRTEALMPLVIQRIQDAKAAKTITSSAQALYDRFGDSEDPKLKILKENPAVAAKVQEQLLAAEKTAKEKGLDIPFSGQGLLENIIIARTGDAEYVEPDYGSILSTPIEDAAGFAKVAAELTAPLPSATFVLDPSIYYIPDTKNIGEAGKAFDTMVIQQASAAQAALPESAAGWTELQNLMEGYDGKDPSARVKLRSLYGQKAYEALASSDNPIAKTIVDSPEMITFSKISEAKITLRQIITSPTADADTKAAAQRKLAELEGRP